MGLVMKSANKKKFYKIKSAVLSLERNDVE